MDRKTTGILVTVITALCCGCPGLLSICWGSLAAFASFVPNADLDIGGSSDPTTALLTGAGALCLGVVFVAIPIAAGFFLLRQQPAAIAEVIDFDEPVPPAI
jgi:hypothetical protein